MSDLTAFRDHCRVRAEWRSGEPRAPCREQTAFGSPKPADHTNCGGYQCGCLCHEPAPRDRALFRRLADEIDAYLAEGDADVDLFGEMTALPETEGREAVSEESKR
ncbi:MAG: hypothetical protein H0X12_13515 [Nocardioides sp.]|nr:hypothetical protein [Nocardioides sp.]